MKIKEVIQKLMVTAEQEDISRDDAIRCFGTAFIIACIQSNMSKYESVRALMSLIDCIEIIPIEVDKSERPN